MPTTNSPGKEGITDASLYCAHFRHSYRARTTVSGSATRRSLERQPMTPEWLTAAFSAATPFVVGVTAYAALRQIRHMRSGNQVAALLPMTEKYQSSAIQASMSYVLTSLRSDLESAEVRAGIVATPMTGPARNALALFNFYETLGALVTAGTLDLELVLRYFTLPSDVWEAGADFIALSRRDSRPEVFENFEALVAMERAYAKVHGTSRYPRHLPHIDAPDRWLHVDAEASGRIQDDDPLP